MHDERITLAGGSQLTGPLMAQHLTPAQHIASIVCTIGGALEQRVSKLMWNDPSYALALDGFGSVAVEALGVAICARLEDEAARRSAKAACATSAHCAKRAGIRITMQCMAA